MLTVSPCLTDTTSLLQDASAGGLFFSAVNPLMRTGVQQQLQTDDLLHLSAAAHPTSSTDDLWNAWQEVRIIPTAMSNQVILPNVMQLELLHPATTVPPGQQHDCACRLVAEVSRDSLV